MISHDLSGFEGISINAPTFSNTLMILEAHNCHLPTSTYPPGNLYYQLLLRLLLGLSHALDSPPSKFQFMLSRTPDLHTLWATEFIFVCRLPMSTLSNSYLTIKCCDNPCSHQLTPWQIFLPSLDTPLSSLYSSTICIVDFPWRTYSCINLHCQFFPLLSWMSVPLGTVLDSLLKCAPRTHLILLQ